MEAEVEKGRSAIRTYALVLGAVFIVHLPTLGIPFHFDDFHHLQVNPSITDLGNIPGFFQDPGDFSGRAGEGMYRPILMTTHALTYAVFGHTPAGYHLVNLLIHLVNTMLVLSFARRATGPGLISAGVALFWGIAAVNHQAVAYASARSSLLATFFILAAVLCTDREMRSAWAGALVTTALFVAGLLSKEIVFILPLLIVLRDITLGRERGWNIKSRWPLYLLLFLVWPAYLVFRSYMFEYPIGPSYVPRHIYMLIQTRVFFYYIWKVIFPVNLTIFPWFGTEVNLGSIVQLAAIFGVVGLVVLAALSIRKAPPITFGIFWFMICLAPTSTLTPLFLTASIERVYPSLVGPVLAVALLVGNRRPSGTGGKKTVAIIFGLLLAFNALVTTDRHFTWWSETKLMREMVKGAPHVSTPWTWLGVMEYREKDYEKGKDYLLKALLLNPNDMVAHENLGKLQSASGNKMAARRKFEEMLRLENVPPDQVVTAYLRLAQIDIQEGNYNGAREKIDKAAEIDPDYYDLYITAGRLEEKTGNLEEAKQYYKKALKAYPDLPEIESQMGIILLNEGKPGEAKKHFLKVAEMGLPWPEVYANLSNIAFIEGDLEKSKSWAEKAIQTDPAYPYGYFYLGGYYANTGDIVKARQNFMAALEKNPDFLPAMIFVARTDIDLAKKSASQEARQQYITEAAQYIRELKKLDAGAAAELEKEWENLTGQEL